MRHSTKSKKGRKKNEWRKGKRKEVATKEEEEMAEEILLIHIFCRVSLEG